METPRGRGLAERLLGLALAVFLAAWLIERAVHLIESVWVPLLLIGLIVAAGSVAIARWRNRYW